MKLLLCVCIIVLASIVAEGAKKYVTNKLYRGNWYKAYHYCYTHGMRLATIKSPEDHDLFVKTIEEAGIKEEFWTAGINIGNNGYFYWMGDSEPMTWTNWKTGEPNGGNNFENCVSVWMAEEWKWNDLNCYQKRPFICENDT